MPLRDHLAFYTNPTTNRRTLREIQQTQDVRNAGQRNRNRQTEDRLATIEADNAQMKLYLVALTRMLLNRKITTPEELQRLIEEVDLMDGEADGKVTGDIRPDGSIAPPPQEPLRTDLDDLADAVGDD